VESIASNLRASRQKVARGKLMIYNYGVVESKGLLGEEGLRALDTGLAYPPPWLWPVEHGK
jgi:hypothetical protein